MFYSFSVKEFKLCLQYGLINKREACFNLGRGDGKGCKGRKVRFNSVQEEQDGQLYCDFFLLFFFQDGGGSLAPLGKCLMPCSDLLCGHSCPGRLKMKRKLSRRNSGRNGFKICQLIGKLSLMREETARRISFALINPLLYALNLQELVWS